MRKENVVQIFEIMSCLNKNPRNSHKFASEAYFKRDVDVVANKICRQIL